jgi:hypothetical protein
MAAMARRARVIHFPGPPQRPAAFVEVCRCRGQGEALVVKGLLEAAGLHVVLRSHVAQSVHPFSVGDQGEIVVLVPAEDAPDARRILARPR